MTADLDQLEEIEALKSIYGHEIKVIDEEARIFVIKIKQSNKYKSRELNEVDFNFEFIPTYPHETLFLYNIHAPWLRHDKLQELMKRLEESSQVGLGTPLVFTLVEVIREFINENFEENITDIKCQRSLEDPILIENNILNSIPSVKAHLFALPNNFSFTNGFKCPEIFHGEPITVKKSVFVAHCCCPKSLAEISLFISTLLTDKKIAQATHNILAWCLTQQQIQTQIDGTARLETKHNIELSDCDDDGETHAGQRLLHLMKISKVENTAVCVTRWYGGTQLGPDRFKCINDVAKHLLVKHNLLLTGAARKDKENGQQQKGKR